MIGNKISCLSGETHEFCILERTTETSFKATFTIIGIYTLIAFGLVDRDIFEENGRKFVSKSANHGFVLISTPGSALKSEDKVKKTKSFEPIKTGEQVVLTFDKENCLLILKTTKSVAKIKGVRSVEKTNLYLILTEKGECVELLSINSI